MLQLLWLSAMLTAVSASNCNICIRERCYSESDFYPNNFTLYYAVIDHNNNNLYYVNVRDSFLNVIELDKNMSTYKTDFLFKEKRKMFLTLNRETEDLYIYSLFSAHFDYPLSYKYNPKSNLTISSFIGPDCYGRRTTLHFCNGTVYGINGKKYALFYMKNGSMENIPGFPKGTQIMEFVCDKASNIYVHASNNIYKVVENAIKETMSYETADGGDYWIPTLGPEGDVYLLSNDPYSRRIYHINSTTNEMVEVGAYESHLKIVDWKFDKHGNIFVDDFNPDEYPVKYFKPNNLRCNAIRTANIKIVISAPPRPINGTENIKMLSNTPSHGIQIINEEKDDKKIAHPMQEQENKTTSLTKGNTNSIIVEDKKVI